jgi:hypothetical protein
MSIKSIITRGFGTGIGVIKDIVTRGFSSGLPPVTNPIDWEVLSICVEERASIYLEERPLVFLESKRYC